MLAKRAQRNQIHKRLPKTVLATNQKLYVHDKTSCDCKIDQMQIPLEIGYEIVAINHYDERSKIVWFAVLLFRAKNSKRVEVYSVDTGYGYFHEHKFGHRKPKDRKDIQPLFSQVAVQECFDSGYDRVMAKYLKSKGEDL